MINPTDFTRRRVTTRRLTSLYDSYALEDPSEWELFKYRLDSLDEERRQLHEKIENLHVETNFPDDIDVRSILSFNDARRTSSSVVDNSSNNYFLCSMDRMSSDDEHETLLLIYSPTLSRHFSSSSNRRENEIERLKQRIESLVKSNDEKERKIEHLQIKMSKHQTEPVTNISSLNSSEPLISSSVNMNKVEQNGNFKKIIHQINDDVDRNIFDSNSNQSLSNQKHRRLSQQVQRSSILSYQNPLSKLKLDVLHRAASAEPMINRQVNNTPVRHRSTIRKTSTFNEHSPYKHDRNGYVSDGASPKYSIYPNSSKTNLDKSKSSSVKGIKSLFGKIIRTQSGSFREVNNQPRRNSFRRTSLKVTNNHSKTFDKPLNAVEATFSRWQTEQIVNWVYGIGLGQYTSEVRKHFKNGLQLLNATNLELEKKIGMKNPLHRKKLQLCLNGLCTRPTEANNLDLQNIQKWLDDIGLPQYKEYFLECKVDGRLLNNLTMDDMSYLNISNEIHYLTVKHSIQILRLNHFDPNYIKHRPKVQDKNDTIEIMHWSNHRLMEWLRSIDLSEYAPNLRGSGVCGALIILEQRFNASTLAEILSIPSSRTLLRRHLTMRFQELLGQDLYSRKLEYEKSSRCQPLTMYSKIKVSRGLFSHRRTRSIEASDLVCPINGKIISNGFTSNLPHFEGKNSLAANRINDELAFARDSPTTFV